MDLVLAGIGPLALFSGRQKNAVSALLKSCRRAIGCKHVAHVYSAQNDTKPETYVAVTYPGRWLLNYAIRNYFNVDPVINYISNDETIRLLNHVGGPGDPVRNMIADAQSFGIGRSFVEIIVMPHSDYRGAVMFSFDQEPQDMKDFMVRERASLLATARRLHLDTLMARGLLTTDLREFSLSEFEVKCVSGLARGKTIEELSVLLGRPVHDIQSMVKQLCDRMECANAVHLVSRCLSLGIVSMFDTVNPQPDTALPMPASRWTHH